MVDYLKEAYQVSVRRSCGLIGLCRATFDYGHRRADDRALRARIREIAMSRPRYGYRRVHVLLRREGWEVNSKRVLRLYREEGLSIRTKRKRKSASHVRVPLPQATDRNQRWSIDFVADRLADGRAYRVLTAVDQKTRESLVLEVAFSLPSKRVTEALDSVIARRGKPQAITIDNGTEFTCHHFDAWAFARGIVLDFIKPGRPVENAFIESFNGRLRDECLNAHWFVSLREAQTVIETWRRDYNETRLIPRWATKRHRSTPQGFCAGMAHQRRLS